MEASEAVAMQTLELAQADSMQRVTMPPEGGITYQRADGTIEQARSREDAIARCPVLGKMSVEEAEILLELAATGSEQLAEEARNAHTRTTTEDEATDERTEDMEPESPSDDPETEVVSSQPDEDGAAAQEEIRKKRLSDDEADAHRKHTRTKEGSDHAPDLEDVVQIIIATNPHLYQDFKNGNKGALNVLVDRAMELRRTAK